MIDACSLPLSYPSFKRMTRFPYILHDDQRVVFSFHYDYILTNVNLVDGMLGVMPP